MSYPVGPIAAGEKREDVVPLSSAGGLSLGICRMMELAGIWPFADALAAGRSARAARNETGALACKRPSLPRVTYHLGLPTKKTWCLGCWHLRSQQVLEHSKSSGNMQGAAFSAEKEVKLEEGWL